MDGPSGLKNQIYLSKSKYIPEIVKREEVKNLLLLPQEIKDDFVKDIENGKL